MTRVSEALPECYLFSFTLFELSEVVSCRIFELLFALFAYLALIVELYIDPGELVYGIILHCLLVAPEPVSCNELTELRAVIAQMIKSDDVIAES